MERYLVLGDSHTGFFTGKNTITDLYPSVHETDRFIIYRIGAPLAYTINKEGTFYKTKERIQKIIEIESIRKMILVFGEIDIRFHIINQAKKQQKDIYEILYKTVDKYLEGVQILFKNIDIVLYSPIATTWLSESCSSRDCPICGSEVDRNLLTIAFDNELKHFCDKNLYLKDKMNVRSLSLTPYLINKNYTTKRHFYMDNIHLNNILYPTLIEALDKLKWNH